MKKSWIVIGCLTVAMVFVLSCKKESYSVPMLPPIVRDTFALDTVLTLQLNLGGEAWLSDDYFPVQVNDSIFYAIINPLFQHYQYNIESVKKVSLIMNRGDTLEIFSRIAGDTILQNPFTLNCACNNWGNTLNYMSLAWKQPMPFTRPEVDAVIVLMDYWILR